MPKSNGQFSPQFPVNRFLDTVGDGTGTKNAIGNYSVTPAVFKLAPPAGEVYEISELIICFTATGNFKGSDYAGIAGGLVNGVTITAKRGGVLVHDVLDGVPIKTNSAYGCLSDTFRLETFSAGTESMVHVSINSREYGFSYSLNGDLSDTLEVGLNDSFVTLLTHHFKALGYK